MRIHLGDGYDAFARVLANSQIAVYAHRVAHGSDVLSSVVYQSPVLFIVTVMKSAFSGKWPEVDHNALEPSLEAPVEYFQKDRFTGTYSVYRSSDGSTRPSTYEECKGLEAAAVWEADQVESRLRDYFAGRSNPFVEQIKATP